MKKITLILLILISLTGCRSFKIFEKSEKETKIDTVIRVERIHDTVFKDRVIEKLKPVFSEIVIEEPCDEEGNLKPFSQNIGSGGNTSGVYSKDGKLHISQKLDSAQSTWEKEYRARWESDSLAIRDSFISELETREEIKVYVYPWWLWLAIGVGSLFALLWAAEKFDLVSRVRRLFFKV